ncbi:MAG: rhodanese-related sulfurtransferase [Burkholderiales bacterium]|jgi:UPF0176 protein|nr:rhodanese-related sulfurtransferase [Burkholderiales bacterium]
MPTQPYLTATFYLFVDLPDFIARKQPLLELCERHNIKGLILLAREGINSTIAGTPADVYAVLAYLREDPKFAALQHKESWSDLPPFHRMKVRLKKEIVTMGVPGISPTVMAGTYVKPRDWNALISDPSVVLIDTRNDYEVELGTFERAIDPRIKTFSQLVTWVEATEVLVGNSGKKPKVAMFCTGGIRCEKSTALMRTKGFDEVYHLEGGILKYLEEIPPEQSQWRGECFVFDDRVSVDHSLQRSGRQLCHNCRDPLPDGAMQSLEFEKGVSCPRCFDKADEAQKRRARERQKQYELAKARKQLHIGAQSATHK